MYIYSQFLDKTKPKKRINKHRTVYDFLHCFNGSLLRYLGHLMPVIPLKFASLVVIAQAGFGH